VVRLGEALDPVEDRGVCSGRPRAGLCSEDTRARARCRNAGHCGAGIRSSGNARASLSHVYSVVHLVGRRWLEPAEVLCDQRRNLCAETYSRWVGAQ
jgi:hypothetical protein